MASVTAFAGDQSVDLSSGSASFTASGIVLGGGHDTIIFTNLIPGTYDFLFSMSSQNVTGLTATVNGQSATVVTLGKLSFAGLEGTSNAPFTLSITGLAGAKATYSGDLTVTPVVTPEPVSMTALAVGLAAIAKRKRKKSV